MLGSNRAIVISISDLQHRLVIMNDTGTLLKKGGNSQTIQTPWIMTGHYAWTLLIRIVRISPLNTRLATRSFMRSSQHTSVRPIQLLSNNRNNWISQSLHISNSLHDSSDGDRCLITTTKNSDFYVYCTIQSCLLFVSLFSWRYKPLLLYFHSPVAGFSLLDFEVSWSHTTTRHSR